MADANLLAWAKGEGVIVDGVAPAELPGSGRGMVAERKITEGETLIYVPETCLLTADRSCGLPPEILETLLDCSIHGQLAGRLCYLLSMAEAKPGDAGRAPWMAVLPEIDDFRDAMPLLWRAELQARLPEAAAKLLDSQGTKRDRDLELSKQHFLPALLCMLQGAYTAYTSIESLATLYSHAWLLVNTRCFFWDYQTSAPSGRSGRGSIVKSRQIQKRKIVDRNDCMALCPVIDCFNHSDKEDCIVSYDKSGFTVTAARSIDAGEAIHVSYGKHSNDFLLVEYGFSLNTNEADYTTLDTYILERLSKEQQELLKDSGFLGGYILDPLEGVCHRTQVAIRLTCLPLRKWQRFIKGVDDGEKDQLLVDSICRDILGNYAKDVQQHIHDLRQIEGSPVNSILQRWEQIEIIIRTGLEKMSAIEC